MRSHYLQPLFAPKSVVMFCASDRSDSVGEIVFRNLPEGGIGDPERESCICGESIHLSEPTASLHPLRRFEDRNH